MHMGCDKRQKTNARDVNDMGMFCGHKSHKSIREDNALF